MARDLVKTASFAALHFSVGFGVTYALTGSAAIATGVALIEPMVNTVVFFLHERVWQRFSASGARARRSGRPASAKAAPADRGPCRE